jgi:hypothetical protein
MFLLNISSSIEGEASVVVTNQFGAIVYTNNIMLNKKDLKLAINLGNQSAGIYFVSAKTEKSISVSKLLLIK